MRVPARYVSQRKIENLEYQLIEILGEETALKIFNLVANQEYVLGTYGGKSGLLIHQLVELRKKSSTLSTKTQLMPKAWLPQMGDIDLSDNFKLKSGRTSVGLAVHKVQMGTALTPPVFYIKSEQLGCYIEINVVTVSENSSSSGKDQLQRSIGSCFMSCGFSRRVR